jgi:hypothetical protein
VEGGDFGSPRRGRGKKSARGMLDDNDFFDSDEEEVTRQRRAAALAAQRGSNFPIFEEGQGYHIIEKILGHKRVGADDQAIVGPTDLPYQEFILVKPKHRSYLHLVWELKDQMAAFDSGNDTKIRRYEQGMAKMHGPDWKEQVRNVVLTTFTVTLCYLLRVASVIMMMMMMIMMMMKME